MSKTLPYDTPVVWTVKDLWELPDDGNRYEVIDGVLYMTPPPNTGHQIVEDNLGFSLNRHIRRHKLGRLFYAPCEVILKRATRGVQPDLFFVPRSKYSQIKKQAFEGSPALIVEISSPSTSRYDRTLKKSLYAQH